MHHTDFVYLGVFVLLFGLVSRRLEGSALTAPILAVVYGVALGPFGLGLMHLEVEGGAVRLLAELTLALVLFHDAARIDLRVLRRNVGIPERLLSVGLVATVALGFGLGVLLLGRDGLGGPGGLGLWQVALVAAMLAPTDAALGQAVVSQESVPQRVRQALNVESGLNDGLVVPLVAIALACAVGGGAEAGPGHWLVHAAKAAGYGVGVGVVGGVACAWLLDRARAAGWAGEGAVHYAVASIPVVAFFGAELLEGSGFLAAFVAGLALGSTTRHLERRSYEFTEDLGELSGHLTWIVFGVAAAPAALECGTPAVIGYALVSLTVVRMAPVALALSGSGFSLRTKLFLGWFGPRGLATVVFAVGALGEPGLPGAEQVFGVAVWTVLLSVLLHGMTAGPLARRYGAFCAAADAEDAPEARQVSEHPMTRRGN